MPEPSPLKTTLPAGRHAICCCGQTSNAPFCDGSHKGTDTSPEILDLEEEKTIAWCTCHDSGKAPMCDGSHRKQGPDAG